MSYEMLEHTADVKFRARGESLDDALAECVSAFAEIVHQDTTVEPSDEIEVEVEAENLEALVFDFLGRLIYVQDAEGVVVCDAVGTDVVKHGDSYSLSAVLSVAPITPEMSLLDIKGPTYNDMRVEDDGDSWLVEAVLDI